MRIPKGTTKVGFVNDPHGQVVIRNTGEPGTDHRQTIYQLGHLVFAVSSLLRTGGNGLVVVKNDSIEAVIHQVLQFRRRLDADRIHQHASVGVRIVESIGGAHRTIGIDLVVGVGVAILHEEIVKRHIELIFADVVGQRVQDLAALLVPDVLLALH